MEDTAETNVRACQLTVRENYKMYANLSLPDSIKTKWFLKLCYEVWTLRPLTSSLPTCNMVSLNPTSGKPRHLSWELLVPCTALGTPWARQALLY